ncbi:MAG: hypothetical protein NVS4B3_19620 [Gemmatimonadaceae bacterium]
MFDIVGVPQRDGIMAVTRWDNRFFTTTKGRIVGLLRRGGSTVDELAKVLGVSDNAVRPHLAALERDGIVHQRGSQRTGGKPATVFEVAPDADRLFSKAYAPVLSQLVGLLAERMPAAELAALLGDVGRRLGALSAPSSGDVLARAQAAAAILTDLGGIVDVEEDQGGDIVLWSFTCPLADAVRAHPAACQAAASLVAAIVGAPVVERCVKGDRPRCCFAVHPALAQHAC